MKFLADIKDAPGEDEMSQSSTHKDKEDEEVVEESAIVSVKTDSPSDKTLSSSEA